VLWYYADAPSALSSASMIASTVWMTSTRSPADQPKVAIVLNVSASPVQVC
jgi:hypothetical protein